VIARIWDGTTRSEDAETYWRYLQETGVRECRRTPGNRGVQVLRRVEGDEAHFRFTSLWDSLDSIRAFAGSDIEKAVYFPKDRQFLLSLDPHVRHYEVLEEPSPAGDLGGRRAP
jgi:heme-degrading monooxygenase HmoA